MNPSLHTSVLVVEDDPFLRGMMVELLELAGFRTYMAPNGQSALEVLSAKKEIACIIADIRMPAMGGLDLLNKVKSLNLESPVMMVMTGYLELEAADIYDMGADAYFEKPFNHKVLIDHMRVLLKPRQERWSNPQPQSEALFMLEMEFPSLIAAQHAQIEIGRGGIAFRLPGPLPRVNDALAFNLLFNEQPPFRFKGSGVVRWAKAGACGVELTYLDDESKLRILRMLTNHPTRAFIPKFAE